MIAYDLVVISSDQFDDELRANNTKRQFGVNKGVVSRAVVKFSCPPKKLPNTACFHFPNTFITHKYILEMIRNVLKDKTDNFRVTALQFVDRNTLHGTQNMDNRWLITFDRVDVKNILMAEGLTLFNKKIVVHSYDEILNEEYQEFIAYQELKEKLFIN